MKNIEQLTNQLLEKTKDLSDEEINRRLLVEMTLTRRKIGEVKSETSTIKMCVLFFAASSIIGGLIAFLSFT